MTLTEHVNDYVKYRRAMGYVYGKQARVLTDFATYAEYRGDRFMRSSTVFDWLSQTSSLQQKHRNLGYLCNLASVLHASDERHEIPDRRVFGKITSLRPTPCLLSLAQIRQIMDAALELGPAGSITPLTFHYIFGLIASTGLRNSEAIHLLLEDLTDDGLLIRNAKFGKSRLVPLTDSVHQAMDDYLRQRRRLVGSGEHLFVLSTGRHMSSVYLTQMFIRLARKCGLRAGPGEPGTRLYDLRHAFASRALENLLSVDRRGVGRHMLALSTYLGHSDIADTYWYLEATPALLRKVSDETEKLHTEGQNDD